MLSVRLALANLGFVIPDDDRAAEAALLYAGEARFELLEFLFQKVLGEGACFPTDDPNSPPDVAELTEDERISRMVVTASFVGLDATSEEIRGEGEFAERLDFLAGLVEVVEACHLPDVEGATLGQQMEKDLQLLDYVCQNRASVLSTHCELFPADLRAAIKQNTYQFQSLGHQKAAYQEELEALRARLEEYSQGHIFNLTEDSAAVGARIKSALEGLTAAARQFDTVYERDFKPWASGLAAPELLGIGPAATGAMAAYEELARVMDDLRAVRAAHQALSESSAREHVPPGEGVHVALQEVIRAGEVAAGRLRTHSRILSESAVRG